MAQCERAILYEAVNEFTVQQIDSLIESDALSRCHHLPISHTFIKLDRSSGVN